MASHAKKRQLPTKWIVSTIVCAVVAIFIITGILLVNNGVLDTLSGIFQAASQPGDLSSGGSAVSSAPSGNSSSGSSNSSDTSEPNLPPPLIQGSGNYARPDLMRGVWLTAGTDYLISGKETAAQIKKQIDSAFASLKEWEFNTVLIPLLYNGKALYPSTVYEAAALPEENGEAFDPLAYILQCARDKGIYIYGILDCHVSEEKGWDPTLEADRKKIKTAAAEAASRYALDGYLIEDYSYAYQDKGSEEAHQQQAPEVDFNQFMSNCIKEAVTDAVQAVRSINRDYYVGLLSNAVWAHATSDERGSGTRGFYEDFTDGRADTLNWLDDKLFDFVLVKDFGSTNLSTANFNTVLDWWNQVTKARGLPLYIAHASDRVGTTDTGWNGSDQLSRQYLSCQEAAEWKGSAYNSLAALKKNTSSTAILIKTWAGNYMSDYVSDTLKVSSPTKTTYTTYESKVSFSGSCNPNFPLTMNGKEIALSEHGYFSLDADLSEGLNTFTFENNRVKQTYKITYELIILQSMAPSKNVTLNGGSDLVIGAVALKDSTVYAMVNGKKIEMKPTAVQPDEGSGDENSDFVNYAGTITLPDGIVGRQQDLGAIKVYATYKNVTKSLTGGRILIAALPDEDEDTELPPVISDLPMLSPSSGGETLTTGNVVVVNSNYAETFSGKTTDDFSRPVNAYMPKGTTDVYVKDVTDPATGRTYYLLGSGRRVYTNNASLIRVKTDFAANTLGVKEAKVESNYTRLSLSADWRIPYNLQLAPQYYLNPNGNPQKYDITKNNDVLDADAFTADHVDITFYYTTEAKATPAFSGSPIIKSAEWIKGDNNTMILRLHLRSAGGFYGYSVTWGEDGTLYFAFKHPANTAANSSEQKLKGIKIVLDPGHGGNSGTVKPIGLDEKTLTLMYSNLLKDKLEALGAKVVMARTTADQNPTLAARAALARNNGTDLFLSIHMNAGGGQGASYHYFNEYSYLVAQRMYEYARKVEDSYSLGKRSRPVTFSPFEVTRLHDTPAVLIECGFYDNQTNYDLLIKPQYQDKFTQAIVDGIVDYFDRLAAASRSSAPVAQEAAPMALWYAADYRKERIA